MKRKKETNVAADKLQTINNIVNSIIVDNSVHPSCSCLHSRPVSASLPAKDGKNLGFLTIFFRFVAFWISV